MRELIDMLYDAYNMMKGRESDPVTFVELKQKDWNSADRAVLIRSRFDFWTEGITGLELKLVERDAKPHYKKELDKMGRFVSEPDELKMDCTKDEELFLAEVNNKLVFRGSQETEDGFYNPLSGFQDLKLDSFGIARIGEIDKESAFKKYRELVKRDFGVTLELKDENRFLEFSCRKFDGRWYSSTTVRHVDDSDIGPENVRDVFSCIEGYRDISGYDRHLKVSRVDRLKNFL